MSVLVSKYFYAALRLANVTKFPDAGQAAPSADQLGDCLQQGQLLISQITIKKAFVYTERLSTYTLGTSKTYTLGPGGTLGSNRPVKIERANLILPTGTPIHLPIFEGTFREFSDLAVQDIPGALPKFLYCDYAFPTATIYLVPQDRGGDKLELYDWLTVPNLVTTSDQVNFPPGYDDWFVFNLAVRLGSLFASQGASVSDDTRRIAQETTRAIASKNTSSPRMSSDVPRSKRGAGGSFNYYSGMDR